MFIYFFNQFFRNRFYLWLFSFSLDCCLNLFLRGFCDILTGTRKRAAAAPWAP